MEHRLACTLSVGLRVVTPRTAPLGSIEMIPHIDRSEILNYIKTRSYELLHQ